MHDFVHKMLNEDIIASEPFSTYEVLINKTTLIVPFPVARVGKFFKKSTPVSIDEAFLPLLSDIQLQKYIWPSEWLSLCKSRSGLIEMAILSQKIKFKCNKIKLEYHVLNSSLVVIVGLCNGFGVGSAVVVVDSWVGRRSMILSYLKLIWTYSLELQYWAERTSTWTLRLRSNRDLSSHKIIVELRSSRNYSSIYYLQFSSKLPIQVWAKW